MSEKESRRVLGEAPTRRQVIAGGAMALAGLAAGSAWTRKLQNATSDDVTHTDDSIHQEVQFKASPKRVYEALTNAKQFDKVVRLGAAMTSGMIQGDPKTEISREAGGAFSLFGGLIVGRHVELVSNQRIVQAWRASADWRPGVYSIVKFELVAEGDGTRLIMDHRGFPDGEWPHLSQGWNANYWEPLAKFLS